MKKPMVFIRSRKVADREGLMGHLYVVREPTIIGTFYVDWFPDMIRPLERGEVIKQEGRWVNFLTDYPVEEYEVTEEEFNEYFRKLE